MKKTLITLSILSAFTLVGCGGGSGGGSKDPVNPPKPVVPEEVIQGIADSLNVDTALVSAVCVDDQFSCEMNQDESRTNVETMIVSKDGLVGFGVKADGHFWNDSMLVFETKEGVQVKDIDLTASKVEFTIHTNKESHTHGIDLSSVSIEDLNDDGRYLALDLEELVNVYTNDNSTSLDLVSERGVKITSVMELVTLNGEHFTYSYLTEINTEAYKAAFDILQQKTDELYQGDSNNQAPVVEVLGSPTLKVGEQAVRIVDAYDPDYDVINYYMEGVSFGSIDHNGRITFNPTLADIGEHVAVIKVVDSKGLATIEEVTYNVILEATDLDPANSIPVFVNGGLVDMRDTDSLAGNLFQVNFHADDADKDSLTYSIVNEEHKSWISISDNGNLTVSPTNEHVGEHEIDVAVTDGSIAVAGKLFIKIVYNTDLDLPALHAEFSNISGMPLEDVQKMDKSKAVRLAIENGKPIVYLEMATSDERTYPTNQRFDLADKTVTYTFVKDDYYKDLNIKDFFDYSVRIESFWLTDLSDPMHELDFQLTGKRSFIAKATHSIGEGVIKGIGEDGLGLAKISFAGHYYDTLSGDRRSIHAYQEALPLSEHSSYSVLESFLEQE